MNCGIGKLFRSSGTYQSALATKAKKSILLFGKIENRDSRYTPYLVDNFRDMLQTQIIELGIEIYDKGSKPSRNATIPSVEPQETQKEFKPLSLSEGLNTILLKSSINKDYNENFLSEKKSEILNSEDIKELAAEHQFNFFIQGAIGNNSSGTLLQEDENSLVFLKLYNPDGKLVGAINYSVSGRTLAEANLLREVSKIIAERINYIVENKKY